ncbi:DKNYY domain-containing protein [Myroides sp. N17-2]|uniref:DKNYY domain-containing protein n=1 Tax=Myroides sp. N17-2 TaxID=2030799 RepID=UPI000EFD96E4|nr:DKNYY domain-containing protein [Myroides sp. N17-2]
MTTLKFNWLDQKKSTLLLSVYLVIIVVLGIFNLPKIVQAFDRGSFMMYVYIGMIILVLIGIFFVKSKCLEKISVVIDESYIKTVVKGQSIKILHSSVLMIKREKLNSGEAVLSVFIVGSTVSALRLETIDVEQVELFIDELRKYHNYSTADKQGSLGQTWVEYINNDAIQSSANISMLDIVRSKEGNLRRTLFMSLGIAFVVLNLVVFVPFIINPFNTYAPKEGKMYYGDKELAGVIPDSCKILSTSVLKDSIHVYYKGEVLEWADHPSFNYLEGEFYSDKNGIYYESKGKITKDKLVPIEGDYDKATFRTLGSGMLYKDINKLYYFETNLLNSSSPLIEIDVEGIDIASFELLDSKWAKDKHQVYFLVWEEVRPCLEIDVTSFEVVDNVTAKDKNYVYYLTKNLDSDNVRATHKDGYAILEDADAPTFKKIEYNLYQDKNTEWSISTAREKKRRDNTVIIDRDDI